MGGGRFGERVALDGGAEPARRRFGEGAGLQGAQAAAPLDQLGPEDGAGGDGALRQLLGVKVSGFPSWRPSPDQP